MGKVAVVLFASLAASALAAGCRQATGQAEDGRYRHARLHFAVAVPEGWTLTELAGDLAVELRGPASGERQYPTAHVFSRRELGTVDLDRTAAEVAALMGEGLSGAIAAVEEQMGEVPTDRARAAVAREAAELGGLPAVRLVRPVKVGAALMRQEMLVAARGREVWALVVTVPAGAEESVTAAVDLIRGSFEVW